MSERFGVVLAVEVDEVLFDVRTLQRRVARCFKLGMVPFVPDVAITDRYHC